MNLLEVLCLRHGRKMRTYFPPPAHLNEESPAWSGQGLFARRWTQGLRRVRRRALPRSGQDEIMQAQLMRRDPRERDLILADVDYGIAIDRVNTQVAAMELDAIELDLVGARPEVGNCCVGRPRLAEDEFIEIGRTSGRGRTW